MSDTHAATPEQVATALAFVSADCDRDKWLKLAMAVKSEFPNGTGFDLWDSWSQTAPDRYNSKDAQAAWRSIDDTGGVGIASLFHIAKQHGWTPQRNGQAPAKPDPVQMAQRQIERLQHEAKKDADKGQRQQQVAAQAKAEWDAAKPCPADHPYLKTKGIKPHGARVDSNGFLMVPMYDKRKALVNIERINPANGKDKKGLKDGVKTGVYFAVGSNEQCGIVTLSEGFATAMSVHECTGYPSAVAFGKSNLTAAALILREKFPQHQIVIVADDEGHGGMEAARKAAEAVGGHLAVPDFGPDRPQGAKDANDLHLIAGAEAVKRCVDGAKPVRSAVADGVVLICGSDLTPEPVIWLWLNWLAKGKLHLLAGAPGQGKTTIAMAFAATVTIGGRWPDGTRCEPGNVLIWSGEDDPADTLLPRLIAAGADRSKVHFVTGTRVDGELTTFDPSRDMAGLKYQAERIGGVSLLIVDPIVSVVTGDSHKNTETRRALQPLVDMAASMGAALLGITHLSKGGQGGDPAQRVNGSVAFTAVARVVLLAAKVKSEEGDDKRILARGKSNIGPDDGGFEYHIEQTEPLPGINACYVTWGEAVSGSARELLTDPNEPQDEQDKSAIDEAQDFLRQALSEGPTPTKTVKKEATDLGISWKTIRRAADALGVIKKKGGMTEGWYWSLPKVPNMAPKDAEDALSKTMGTFGTLRESMGTFDDGNSADQVPEIPPKPTKNDAGKWAIPRGDVSDVEVL